MKCPHCFKQLYYSPLTGVWYCPRHWRIGVDGIMLRVRR